MKLKYVGYIMSNLSLSFDNDGRVYVKAQKNILRITVLMFIHTLVLCAESPCSLTL